MVKEKLFSKFKKKVPEPKEMLKTKTQSEPLAEYNDILYTANHKSKKQSYAFSDQMLWRDIHAIEKSIDTIHITSVKKPSNELDKIVDRLIEKKKK
ncbi:MAG: hypothetical protein QHH15_01560 [Candidatus Thermoplasmatota archaeon]|nr:hypothetical protein [Candidatus Thermoplasmatota archaeon]